MGSQLAPAQAAALRGAQVAEGAFGLALEAGVWGALLAITGVMSIPRFDGHPY
jgi:hypothetical protein